MLLLVNGESDLDRRILDAVGATIYAEGINGTGVDRLSQVAQVSKRTLYQHFRSKDDVVTRALAALDDRVFHSVTASAEAARGRGESETAQILAVFDELVEMVDRPDFRGCPFLNARAELADRSHPAHAVIDAHKARLGRWFELTARRGALHSPVRLAGQLMALHDGVLISGPREHSRRVARDARAAAVTLVNAARGSRSPRRTA